MIDGATREDIVRWNRYQYEKEKRKKYRRKLKIFTYGFYIGMIRKDLYCGFEQEGNGFI